MSAAKPILHGGCDGFRDAQPILHLLFAANATGNFTTAAQRFAYDTTDGALFFNAHGSAAHSSQELIATLTHSPTLTASDISFVA